MLSKISIDKVNFQKKYSFYKNSRISDYKLKKIISSLKQKKLKIKWPND